MGVRAVLPPAGSDLVAGGVDRGPVIQPRNGLVAYLATIIRVAGEWWVGTGRASRCCEFRLGGGVRFDGDFRHPVYACHGVNHRRGGDSVGMTQHEQGQALHCGQGVSEE